LQLITECITKKLLKIVVQLKSIYNLIISFDEQKCIFEKCGKLKTIGNPIMTTFWLSFNLFFLPFQNCPL
jgi:hypothetical protein